MILTKDYTDEDTKEKKPLLWRVVKCPVCRTGRLFDIPSYMRIKVVGQSLQLGSNRKHRIYIKCLKCGDSVPVRM